MKLNSFYEATTALCFGLLGFWWVVIQMRHDEFTSDRRMRAIAYNVSLSFVLPGLMSLTALLAVENNALWRVGFGVAGLAGALQSAYVIATPATFGVRRGILRAGRWATLVLYALIALVALRPQLAERHGDGRERTRRRRRDRRRVPVPQREPGVRVLHAPVPRAAARETRQTAERAIPASSSAISRGCDTCGQWSNGSST